MSMRPAQPRAFTLTEMTVVIGIIILVLLMAIPAIRAMTGSRSLDAAQNQVSAIIGQARQDAIGLQEYRGVFFYIDPANDRITAALVRSIPQANPPASPQVFLDTTPTREFLLLPQGVGVQTVNNPTAVTPDKYIGFNPGPAATRYGGIILFDPYGRLVSRSCGFQLTDTNGLSTGMQTILGSSLATPNATWPPPGNAVPFSQFGLVLYDRESFKNAGGTDGDVGLDSADPNVTSANEMAEEAWLDTNATPILINRYNGTLIKGE